MNRRPRPAFPRGVKRALLPGLFVAAGAAALFVLLPSRSGEERAAPRSAARSAGQDAAPPAPEAQAADDESTRCVRGRVEDADGAPVAGARVRLLHPWSRCAETVADGQGRFAVPCTDEELFRCFVSAPGFIPAAGPWREGAGHGEVDAGGLVLERGGLPISGRVTDPDGTGLAEVEVFIEAEQPDEIWDLRGECSLGDWAKTAADGSFAFHLLPPGLYRVRARLWRAPRMLTFTMEHLAAGTDDVRLIVPAARRQEAFALRLKVQLPDGTPLPRGLLVVGDQQDYTREEITNGRVETEVLGYPPFSFLVVPFSSGPVGPTSVTDLPAGVCARTITLEPGLELRGVVLAGGAPLPGAKVRVCPIEKNDRPGRAVFGGGIVRYLRTTADGRFVATRLLPGLHRVWVECAGYRTRIVAVEAGAEELVVELDRSLPQEILLVPPPGEELGAGRALLWQLTPLGTVFIKSETVRADRDARGSSLVITFHDLTPGAAYRLRAGAGWSWPGPYAPVTRDFRADGEPVRVAFETGHALAGRVVREDGAPVPVAAVGLRPDLPPASEYAEFTLSEPWTTTDLEGRFTLEHLADEAVGVTAAAPGLVQRSPLRVTPGSAPVEIVLVPASTLCGQIVPPPPPDFRVDYWRVLPDGPAERIDIEWDCAGTDGHFRHDALPPGQYRIVAYSVGDPADDRYVVTPPIDAGTHDLRLALVPGARIEGLVLDPHDRPLEEAHVVLEAEGWSRTTQSDARGRFVFPGLPPGSYGLRLRSGEALRATTGTHVVLRRAAD